MGKRGAIGQNKLPAVSPIKELEIRATRAKSALRTLNRADKIRNDKHLMSDIRKLAK